MPNNQNTGFIDVLIGLQWGDEGKGKNIDELISSGNYSGVARFQGGANAGHTLKCGDLDFIGHIIPSGCLHKGVDLFIGNGVVVDVNSIKKEMAQLDDVGFDIRDRLFISNRAKLVSYMHPFIDHAEEHYRSRGGKKIGTTARGIGPAYSDSRSRRGLLVGNILDDNFEEKVEELEKRHLDILEMFRDKYGFKFDRKEIEEKKKDWWEAVRELQKLNICDVSSLLLHNLKSGKNILAEGAQGAMLDIDFGDYPNVTSSNTLPANACLGLGVPHNFIRDIYGVAKAYTTKVGGGNFPARIDDTETEELFQKAGNEFGATTGRPRMCGWLDLFALRYAIEISGVNKIFINKVDICPTDKIKIVTGYKVNDKKVEDFPLCLNDVSSVITEDLPGWGNSNFGTSDIKNASKELIAYLDLIKGKLPEGVKIVSIGTGPDREHSFEL